MNLQLIFQAQHELNEMFVFILDPIFPLVFLINSWIPGMFDVIFQTTFISTLMLFWLCLYHGIRQVGTAYFILRVYIIVSHLTV